MIHQLIIAFKCANDCYKVPIQRTFAVAHELDANLLVHIFGQVQNGFFLWLIVNMAASTATMTAASSSAAAAMSLSLLQELTCWKRTRSANGAIGTDIVVEHVL